MLKKLKTAVFGVSNSAGTESERHNELLGHVVSPASVIDLASDRILAANSGALATFGLTTTSIADVPASQLVPGLSDLEPDEAHVVRNATILPLVTNGKAVDAWHAETVVLPLSRPRVVLVIVTNEGETTDGDTEREIQRLTAILDTAVQISVHQDPASLAMSTAKTLNHKFGYYHVRVYLNEDSGMVRAAEYGGEAIPARDMPDQMVAKAAELKDMIAWNRSGEPMIPAELQFLSQFAQVAVPVAAMGELYGAIYIQCGIESHVTEADRQTVTRIARQLAYGIGNLRLKEQAAGNAAVDERRRLARELHDSVSGDLAGLLWQMEDLVSLMSSGQEVPTEQIRTLRDATRETLAESRKVVWNLRSDSEDLCPLSELLRAELESVERISGMRTQSDLEFSGVGLRADVELALLRIAQEAINNARRHSGARALVLTLNKDKSTVSLSIADDGKGMTGGSSSAGEFGGFGITSMRERAMSVGSELEIYSDPENGTRIELTVENAFER